MSFNSKKTIASAVSCMLFVIAYVIFALGKHAPEQDNIKSWAISMLVFIGIGVAFVIAIQIIFHIVSAIRISTKEQEYGEKGIGKNISSLMVEDERDKLINLKSAHVGYIFAGIGFVAALSGLAFGLSSVIAVHILLGSFVFGSIAEGFVSVYYYEKGVGNG